MGGKTKLQRADRKLFSRLLENGWSYYKKLASFLASRPHHNILIPLLNSLRCIKFDVSIQPNNVDFSGHLLRTEPFVYIMLLTQIIWLVTLQ